MKRKLKQTDRPRQSTASQFIMISAWLIKYWELQKLFAGDRHCGKHCCNVNGRYKSCIFSLITTEHMLKRKKSQEEIHHKAWDTILEAERDFCLCQGLHYIASQKNCHTENVKYTVYCVSLQTWKFNNNNYETKLVFQQTNFGKEKTVITAINNVKK